MARWLLLPALIGLGAVLWPLGGLDTQGARLYGHHDGTRGTSHEHACARGAPRLVGRRLLPHPATIEHGDDAALGTGDLFDTTVVRHGPPPQPLWHPAHLADMLVRGTRTEQDWALQAYRTAPALQRESIDLEWRGLEAVERSGWKAPPSRGRIIVDVAAVWTDANFLRDLGVPDPWMPDYLDDLQLRIIGRAEARGMGVRRLETRTLSIDDRSTASFETAWHEVPRGEATCTVAVVARITPLLSGDGRYVSLTSAATAAVDAKPRPVLLASPRKTSRLPDQASAMIHLAAPVAGAGPSAGLVLVVRPTVPGDDEGHRTTPSFFRP